MPKAKKNLRGFKKTPTKPKFVKPLHNKGIYLKGNDLRNLLVKWHPCGEAVELEEVTNKRAGHVRCIKVSCKRCQLESYLQSGGVEAEKIKPCYREEPVTSINRSFAFASDVAGLDFEQLKLFCSILDIPGPPDSYDTVHQGVIHSTLLKQIKTRLAANRKHSFDNALQHVNGKAIVSVKTDGTYQKRGDCRRGYTSKIGVVLLTDAYSGKFLDFRVMTKFCHTCTQHSKRMSANEFSIWREKHVAEGKCSSSYEGPSTEMERVAVKEMFSKSLNYNLMYRYLVGDGDSKYSSISKGIQVSHTFLGF